MQMQGVQKAPSARTLARLMGMGRDHLTKADTVIVAAVEAGVPGLADARGLVERFQTMIRTKAAASLDGWIEHARASLIAPLARGVAKDVAAIRAAITEPWSNGQTEGPDYQAQAGQAADVWPRQARPPQSTANRRGMTPCISGTASEPLFHAYPHRSALPPRWSQAGAIVTWPMSSAPRWTASNVWRHTVLCCWTP